MEGQALSSTPLAPNATFAFPPMMMMMMILQSALGAHRSLLHRPEPPLLSCVCEVRRCQAGEVRGAHLQRSLIDDKVWAAVCVKGGDRQGLQGLPIQPENSLSYSPCLKQSVNAHSAGLHGLFTHSH